MKKCLALFLILFCMVALVACNNNINDNGNDNGCDIIKQAYFRGKVIEVYDTSCLIEVTDTGNQQFAIGNKVVVNTDVDGCPQYAVGDYLRVVFDGKVAKSYPPQILSVYNIHKTDEIGNNID